MTTPRVTVPVEPTEAMLDSACSVGPDTNNGAFSHDDARTVFTAMLSAAPAPEGGAVETAVKIATDLHHAYEQLIYGLPKYLEAENLTDEENMIREAWITLDVTAHRLAALATREEAPAEAGEHDRIKRAIADGFSNGYEQYDDASEMQRLSYDMAADAVLSLRAQPPAREDALRVAVEALETINHIRSEMVGVPVDSEAANAWALALDAAADHARQALVALQAEQGAK